MTSEWTDADLALFISRLLRDREGRVVNPVLLESMDSFEAECRFLAVFLGYTHHWSDAHKVVPNLDSLIGKVAAAAKVFRNDLHNAFVDNYSDYYILGELYGCTVGFADLWRRTRHRIRIACFFSMPSVEFLDVFARLNEKIELLKPQIRDAYNGYLSAHPFHPLPRSRCSSTSDFDTFCQHVEWNLQFLSEKSDFVGPLGKHMKALQENLYSLRCFLNACLYEWFSMKNDIANHFGAVAVRAAHVCCLCWFAEMDQSLKNDMTILLANMQQKIDLASPDFLTRIMEFLCETKFEGYIDSLVMYMLGVQSQTVLHDELVSLIICLIKILLMPSEDAHRFSVDIKAVVKEARNLKNKDYRACKNDLALLFARIWFLKAEIFLMEQLNSSTLMLSMEDQIKAFNKGSKFLTTSFTPAIEKTENRILELTEEVPGQVEFLCRSSHAKEFMGNKVRDVLYKFLVNIMLFKAKALLLELLKKDAILMVPVHRQIGTLREGIIFVIVSEINQPKENTEDEKLILTYCEAVAARVISFCNSFPAEEITEEAVMDLEHWLSDMLEMIQLLKTKLKELYFQGPRLNFPKTPGLGFVEFLSQKLTRLLSDKLDSLASVTHQIEAIRGDLEFLICLFRDVMEKNTKNQEQKDNCTQLINLTYEAEYVVDSMVVGNAAKWHHLLWLYHVSEEIRHIRIQVTDNYEKEGYDIGIDHVPQILRPLRLRSNTQNINEDVIALNDQQQVIIDLLTRGSLQRDIISIVGMGGIGKTTLANKVYDDPKVFYCFHVRAWCHVSQVYRKRDLLLDILSHIVELTDSILAMADEDLDLVLYKHLKTKRYLIVMDDMWDIGAWEELQSSFPDDRNGSRILITSRLRDVVPQVALGSNLLNLRRLSDSESWELLKMKIFHEEDCPEELLEVGMEIARNCKGLPLSLVAIAGILNCTMKQQDLWRQIAESLNSLIVVDQQTRCMDILELSYKHLPDDLKACFLYLGIFEEDKEIPVSRLMWLWMAEGFIQEKDSESLEDLAKDYLMDLIDRSLVIASKRRSNGEVKACRVHDMVRSLCLLKAKQENFLQLVTSKDEPYASFDDSVDFDDFDPLSSMKYEEHRLCIWASRKHFVMSRPSGQYVRSLLFFATSDAYPRCPCDVSFISKNFELLKVLDLQCINMGSTFADGLELLVQLSYLAVGGDISLIPLSFVNLRNLETFLVKGLKGKIILPDSIWRMTRLRHLHVDNHAIFTLQNDMNGSSHQLNNLVSLSSPSLSILNGEHAEEIMRRLPNLRKLRCILSKSREYSEDCSKRFPRFKNLTRLESLKISYHGKTLNMDEFNFPLNLKKLTLSNFWMRWDHISTIGRLEKLEVLKLVSVALEDKRWEMRESEFPELKFLKLETLNIEEWKASSGDLPKLQHLVLRKCKKLKEVPLDFVNIPTFQIIEVQQSGVSVEESIRRIEEEQIGYGIEDLKVLINH